VHKPEFGDDNNYVGLNWFIDAFIGININGLKFDKIMLLICASKTPKPSPVSRAKVSTYLAWFGREIAHGCLTRRPRRTRPQGKVTRGSINQCYPHKPDLVWPAGGCSWRALDRRVLSTKNCKNYTAGNSRPNSSLMP
jgi:hypothetical protein